MIVSDRLAEKSVAMPFETGRGLRSITASCSISLPPYWPFYGSLLLGKLIRGAKSGNLILNGLFRVTRRKLRDVFFALRIADGKRHGRFVLFVAAEPHAT